MTRKVVLSIFLQLLSIPIFYWILYAIAKLFHEPRTGGDGMDFNELELLYLSAFIIVTLPFLNFVLAYWVPNMLLSILIHLAWIILIVWIFIDDLSYHPYDFGLILFCIGLTLPIRLILIRLLKGQG